MPMPTWGELFASSTADAAVLYAQVKPAITFFFTGWMVAVPVLLILGLLWFIFRR